MSANTQAAEAYTRLIADKNGITCSHCGSHKSPSMPFCRTCLSKLPLGMQAELASPIGAGYAEAKESAHNYLQTQD